MYGPRRVDTVEPQAQTSGLRGALGSASYRRLPGMIPRARGESPCHTVRAPPEALALTLATRTLAISRPHRLSMMAALTLGLWLCASGASAANLLTNGGFDGGTSGWQLVSEPGRYRSEWRAEDATGDVASGSVRIEHLGDAASAYTAAIQCVAVSAGATYQTAARFRVPAGQSGSGAGIVGISWYASPGCSGGYIQGGVLLTRDTVGGWNRETGSVTAPAGAVAARIELQVELETAGTTLFGDFDDIEFADDSAGGTDPVPPYGSWIDDPDLPGFDAQVRITPAGAPAIQATAEDECIPETLCVAGALAGRPEIFVKVIGPRPNGFLWVQLIRFTPSKVEVWLRQEATGLINYYRLDALPPTGGPLVGVEDRTAYLP